MNRTHSPDAMHQTKHNLILWCILLGGALLRLAIIHIDLANGEAMSIYTGWQPLGKIIPCSLRGYDAHLPLFAFLIHFLLIFSNSEIWLRFWVWVCGVAAIYMTYNLGKLIFKNHSVAILAAFLLAFSEAYIYFSVALRVYMVWGLSSLCSTYAFIRLMQCKSFNAGRILWYLVPTLICVYAHYFGFFIILAQVLFFLAQRRTVVVAMRKWIALYASIGILLLPQLLYGWLQFQRFPVWGQYFELAKPRLLDTTFMLFTAYSDNFIFSALYITIVLVAASRICTHMVYANRRKNLWNTFTACAQHIAKNSKVQLIAFFLFLPMVIVAIVSKFNGKYFICNEERYFMPFFIFYYFLIAWCIASFSKRWRILCTGLIIILLVLNASRYTLKINSLPRNELHDVALILKPKLSENDIVVVGDIFNDFHLFNLLRRHFKIITTPQDLKKYYFLKIFAFKNDEAFVDFSHFKKNQKVWLVADRSDRLPSMVWFIESKNVALRELIHCGKKDIRLYQILPGP